MFSKELFGQRISKLRKKNGERQEDLAAVLSLGKTAVCEIEKGNSSSSVERLALICLHYHVSADYLLGLIDDPIPYHRTQTP